MPLQFAPGAAGRAHYSDTGFPLFAEVVATVRGEGIDATCSALFAEMGVRSSACLNRLHADGYVPIAVPGGHAALRRVAASTGSEIASPCAELAMLLRAWFAGAFHPRERLRELQQWQGPTFHSNTVWVCSGCGCCVDSHACPDRAGPENSLPNRPIPMCLMPVHGNIEPTGNANTTVDGFHGGASLPSGPCGHVFPIIAMTNSTQPAPASHPASTSDG